MCEQYSKTGVNLFPRWREQAEALIPSGWRVERYHSQAKVLQDDPIIGQHVMSGENVTDVYRVVKV